MEEKKDSKDIFVYDGKSYIVRDNTHHILQIEMNVACAIYKSDTNIKNLLEYKWAREKFLAHLSTLYVVSEPHVAHIISYIMSLYTTYIALESNGIVSPQSERIVELFKQFGLYHEYDSEFFKILYDNGEILNYENHESLYEAVIYKLHFMNVIDASRIQQLIFRILEIEVGELINVEVIMGMK